MNENLTFIHEFVHFMKWIAKYIWICPFHKMDSWVVHFMKWTICLSISRNGQFHIWVITYILIKAVYLYWDCFISCSVHGVCDVYFWYYASEIDMYVMTPVLIYCFFTLTFLRLRLVKMHKVSIVITETQKR